VLVTLYAVSSRKRSPKKRYPMLLKMWLKSTTWRTGMEQRKL